MSVKPLPLGKLDPKRCQQLFYSCYLEEAELNRQQPLF
jgi:hypothetical protein